MDRAPVMTAVMGSLSEDAHSLIGNGYGDGYGNGYGNGNGW